MEQEVATVGLDLAKNVFQVHAIAPDGTVLIKRKLLYDGQDHVDEAISDFLTPGR